MRSTGRETHLCKCLSPRNGDALGFAEWALDPTAIAGDGAIQHARQRYVHDSNNRFAVFDQTDLDGKVAVAVDETVRAVEWIDHPHARLAQAAFSIHRFFCEYAIARKFGFQSVDD